MEPSWYDEKRLRKAWYVIGEYSGWVIDLGDGTCRYANIPLLGDDPAMPQWGDKVPLIETGTGLPFADSSRIIERYEPSPAPANAMLDSLLTLRAQYRFVVSPQDLTDDDRKRCEPWLQPKEILALLDGIIEAQKGEDE